MTRIPQLEQELVAAAARLQSPRRLVWPVARAALAAGAVVAVIVLAVVVAADNDPDRRPKPAGALPSPPNANEDGTRKGATLPERQKIARTADKWARLFAFSDFERCSYMNQPACERATCVRVGPRPIPNCTRPSPAFRRSFARAKVEDVEIKGDRAAARFSNGKWVELERLSGDVWWISKWGRAAGRGFFE